MLILAIGHGLAVTAHHVDHGHRPSSSDDAARAVAIAKHLNVSCVVHRAELALGANFEARAREVRYALLPSGAMTGHTADDLAETVLLRLIHGSGPDGLAAIEPGIGHPILSLRRADTVEICRQHGIEPVDDPTNHDSAYRRNRVRHELIPLLGSIAERDVVPLLTRLADLARADRRLLDNLAAAIDPTDAKAVAAAPRPLAQRALRRWLANTDPNGYPPSSNALERVLAVARGQAMACELPGNLRVERSQQRLRLVGGPDTPGTIATCHDD